MLGIKQLIISSFADGGKVHQVETTKQKEERKEKMPQHAKASTLPTTVCKTAIVQDGRGANYL
jgi:hypothetical protein